MTHSVSHDFYSNALVGNTWSEFLQQLRVARSRLGNSPVIWYRGVSDVGYKLIPSLLRYRDGLDKEAALFNDYQRSATRLLPERKLDWELLFDMQHHGIPTRLLDWTDVLGVAVAFALYDSSDDSKASAIFILDPAKLNSRSGRGNIIRPTNDADFSYKSMYWDNRPTKPVFPIAVDGPLHTNRLVAQSGAFTVHGADENFFYNDVSDCLQAISIEPAAKSEAREFLEYANLNAFSLYPDMVGMARHITRKYFP